MPYHRHNANCSRNSSSKLIDMITEKELLSTFIPKYFMLFSTFRIDESSAMSASGDGLFKYGETTSKWDLVGFIVNLLVLAHLETLARS